VDAFGDSATGGTGGHGGSGNEEDPGAAGGAGAVATDVSATPGTKGYNAAAGDGEVVLGGAPGQSGSNGYGVDGGIGGGGGGLAIAEIGGAGVVTGAVVPIFSVTGATAPAIQGGSAVAVPGAAPTTVITGDLTGATVRIANFQQGDVLSFTGTAAITGSYNAGTGVLTLSGADTAAHYAERQETGRRRSNSWARLSANRATAFGRFAARSKSGTTSLDLRDIKFVSGAEATFAGASSGGTLTVTDGVHTAKIKLIGNYVGTTFTASADGSGGTTITDYTPAAVHAFVAAMAATGGPAGSSLTSGHSAPQPQTVLVQPRP